MSDKEEQEEVMLDDAEIERRYRAIFESYTEEELEDQHRAARRRVPSWAEEQ